MSETDITDSLIGRLEREQRDVIRRIAALETLVATYDALLDAIVAVREEAGMTFVERVFVVTIAVIFGSVFIEGVLAAITPNVVAIFLMVVIGRLVWVYTGRSF